MGGTVPVYYEAAAVITVLVLLGQVLELRARDQTGGAIRALLNLAPKTARRLRDGGADEEVPLGEVQAGDRLRVRPGDGVPVDGTNPCHRPYSRKNRLYFAFRELGRAVRTDFLLRFLPSIELRRVIQAATNKSELFNKYAQWVSFGSAGLSTAAERDEQRKMVKYNHLVANLLIFHTAVSMTRAIDEIAANGHGTAITPKALAGTSPYLNEHLNRFGSYELDLSRLPLPLPFELPPQRQPSRQGTNAPV